MQKESSFERRGRSSRPPFRRRKKNRHPGLAERDVPRVVPKPKGELPEAFASNVFGLVDPLIQHAVADEEYATPTPIQEQAIPSLLEGRDLLGCAQTGTGKTAAFLLPILHKLYITPKETEAGHPRALILAPTRELAAQIATSVATYGRYLGLPFAVVFGGVSQFPQVQALRHRAVLVVATPGRLLDLMEQKHLALDCIEEFVLDEADRMLDMGFMPDIRKILAKLPTERHTQFFSATLSPEVLRLARDMVVNPVSVTIEPDKPTVDKIDQRLMFVDKPRKDALLAHLFNSRPEMSRVIVFARTRHGADKIVRKLEDAGVPADAIHSDKTQRARTDALNAFKRGRVRALVATDIASRGIDVEEISHVVNFDLPEETESYIHRIGRTARAGASGCAISFVSSEERGLLRAVERMIKKSIQVERVDEFHSERAEKAAGRKTQSGNDEPLPPPPWAARKPKATANREDRRAAKFSDRPPRDRDRPPRGGNLGRRQDDFRQRMLDESNISDEGFTGRKPRRSDDDTPPRPEDEPPRRDDDARRPDSRADRPPRRSDRPRRPDFDRPRRSDSDRPPKYSDRPRYSDPDQPPRREDTDRPPRRSYDDRPPRFADRPRNERRPERFEKDWRDEGRPPRRPYERDDSRGYERRRSDDERPGRSRDFEKRDFERPPRFDEGRRDGEGFRPKRPYREDGPPRRDDRRFDDERSGRPQKFQKGKFGKKPGFRADRGEGARKAPNAPHPFARFQKKKKR